MLCSSWVLARVMAGAQWDWTKETMRCAASRHSSSVGDQREADAAGTRVDAVRLARQQAAGQHRDIVFCEQPEGERDIVAVRATREHIGPEVEAGVGQRHRQHRAPAAA